MVIGIIIVVIIGILLLGLAFKLVKLALVIALIVGGVVLVQRYIASNNDRPRLP